MISTLFIYKSHQVSSRNANIISIVKKRSLASGGKDTYQTHYQVLGLRPDSDQEEVRKAFIHLARKYHPDSQHQEANGENFARIETAYRKLQEKFAAERCNANNKVVEEYGLYDFDAVSQKWTTEEVFDIEHTAPQHRQFLSNDGIGHGTPYEREKQFQQHKVMKAVESVYTHKLSLIHEEENAILNKNVQAAKKIQSRYGIERVVEDLIQESMSKGEFKNLKGTGKPLQYQNHNPFIDVVTHKVNQVLIENGFSPQWVTLEKEIRLEIANLKNQMKERRSRLGGLPLSISDETEWKKYLSSIMDDVASINKKIDNFNLIVPLIDKQRVHVNLRLLSEKVLSESPTNIPPVNKTQSFQTSFQPSSAETSFSNFLGLFSSIWK